MRERVEEEEGEMVVSFIERKIECVLEGKDDVIGRGNGMRLIDWLIDVVVMAIYWIVLYQVILYWSILHMMTILYWVFLYRMTIYWILFKMTIFY